MEKLKERKMETLKLSAEWHEPRKREREREREKERERTRKEKKESKD